MSEHLREEKEEEEKKKKETETEIVGSGNKEVTLEGFEEEKQYYQTT